MSIIQTIRDKATWAISIIIGLSLIGFLLMDAGKANRLKGANDKTLGSVNGMDIDRKEYEEAEKNITEQYKQIGDPVDMAKEQAWSQLVVSAIVDNQSEKLGLSVTPKELTDMLLVNPSEDIKKSFTNPQTGQFDPDLVRQQLEALKKSKEKTQVEGANKYLQALSKNKLQQKFMALLTNTTYYPKWMLEKITAENNTLASVNYISVPYTSITDTSKIADAEITNYVAKHKEQYKQVLTRSLSYVALNAFPSFKDSLAILTNLDAVKAEMATTTEAEINNFIARNGSEIEYSKMYVLQSKLSVPHADTIKKLSDGAVFGPYLDPKPQAGTGNYTLAKMIGKRSMPDSIKCRHILIKIADQQKGEIRTDSAAKQLIDSIATAIKGGASFEEMVLKFSEDEGSKNKKGEYEFGSLAQLVEPFYETVFYEPVGTKKVVKAESGNYSGYHYIEVLTQKNFEPAYKIAYLSKSIVASQFTEDSVSGLANQFLGESRTAKDFKENAEKRKYTVLPAADIKPNDATVGNLGNSREIVRWMYKADKGEVSDQVYNVGNSYVVAMLTDINPEGTMSAAKARVMVENLIRNEHKSGIIKKKIGSAHTLEAIATAMGQQVLKADSLSFLNPFFPNGGSEPKVGGYVFNTAAKGKVSAPIAGNGGVYVVKPDNVFAKVNGAVNIEQQRETMLSSQRSMGAGRAMEALKKTATIKDNRSEVY
jgi:peptidyl-prolyl cis-trans isomerase D